jgi:anti-sigma factor RsiW
MPCAEFEGLLAEYAELSGDARLRVHAHMEGCADCREFLEALHRVDAALAAQFSGRGVSAEFERAVRRRVRGEPVARRPSFVPEILDFIGWGAIMALIGLALYWARPLLPIPSESERAAFSLIAAWTAGATFLLIGFFIGLRSLVDLKH